MLVSVILPTYNERGNILPLIKEIQVGLSQGDYDADIIVVDDNSPDGTGRLVAEQTAPEGEVRLFVRTEERGLASAIKFGIGQARGEALVVMDTDFNHDPRMLAQMVSLLQHYDLVIGSRFVPGGGMDDVLRYRLSLVFNYGVRILLASAVRDHLSGFFAIRRHRLQVLDCDRIFVGYGDYFTRLIASANRKGFSLIEVPVFYRLRRQGESKTKFFRTFIQYSVAAVRLKVDLLKGRW